MLSSAFLWLTVVLLFFSLSVPASTLTNRPEEIIARDGVVATDDGRCSEIGMKVLKDGGHAVDAAVAAAFCLGVVSPASSGIGGGAFMLIRLANGTTQAFDMRETAPMRATEDMYQGNEILKKIGILSVGVPGEVAGLRKAWEQHHKLPWARLVQPAEGLAREGFKVSPFLRFQMEKTQSGILLEKGLRKIFASNGNLLKVNDTCRNIKLADTLKLISEHGSEIFYNGEVGRSLIIDIQKAGGILTMEDLQNYEVKMREPIIENVLGLKLIGMPPPSSGAATMMLILNILAQYQDDPLGLKHALSGDLGVHRKIEALKYGFAVRSDLGDPDFVNVSAVLSNMLSPSYAKIWKENINDNKTFGRKHYNGSVEPAPEHGTSHVSIVDSDRNAVSMTCTVNAFFGSQILSKNTGIVLNNQMDDFSMPSNDNENTNKFPPARYNFIAPGKRPLSSMSPTIVLKDDNLKAVLGASGGANIIAATTQVLLNRFVHEMDPLSAVMAPRFYHTWIPNAAQCENWASVIGDHYQISEDTLVSLRRKGHRLKKFPSAVVCQYVELRRAAMLGGYFNLLVGVSDPRKGGIPAGYGTIASQFMKSLHWIATD